MAQTANQVNIGTKAAPNIITGPSSGSSTNSNPVLTQGQSYTDSAGRTGTVNFDVNTGKQLAAGATTQAWVTPGAPTLGTDGNPVPGTGSTQTANSGTAASITNPPNTPPPAPLNTNPTSPTAAGVTPPGGTTGASGGGTGGIPGLEGGTPLVNGQMSTKYNTALTGLNNGGSDAPTDSGSGAAAANKAATTVANNTPQTQDNSAVTTALANDPGYQQLLQDQEQYQSAENQQKSLADQYTQLENQYDIPGIQSQLLNMNNVINGTEDDIRTEVTAANGFATNSQVLALSDARNKTLIQNYNNLQSTLTNAQNQVTTMIGLDEKDQANALSAITTKMGIDEQVSDYATKFQSNAKEGYSTIISAVGINGLYNSLMNSDPTGGALATAAQIMGMTPAEMKSASDTAQQSQNLDTESKQLSIESSESGLATSALDRQSTELDIKTKQQNLNDAAGLPDPAKAGQTGYSDTGIKLTTDNGSAQVIAGLKAQPGAINSKNQVTPAAYNAGLAWWVSEGLNPSDYATTVGQYKATSGPWVKEYNK